MGQNLSVSGQLDHVLLAMNSHEIKRVVRGLAGMLGSLAKTVNHELPQATEMLKVAQHIQDMQQAIGGLLANIDDVILTLDRACPSVGQSGVLVQPCEMEGYAPNGEESSDAERNEWVRNISELPPHLRN